MKVRAAVLAGVALFAGGCGGSEKTLETSTVLATLRAVGLSDLHVRSYGDADFIFTGTFGNPALMPMTVTRLESVKSARSRFANDQRLLQGQLSPADRAALPRGYDPERLTDVRVCNLVITSYNSRRDAVLATRVERAVTALRAKC